ncbi:hypothetical protein [Paractinoplanes brasiliensis]|uniref:Transcriptional regulator n=1 Tax=Paractinoplanes brasiliensis TaxID=52695 RepID=A0A4R6JT96_9ACTN|nr:hypothetical protein [Actinoplanes brasiliensis]TDO39012.1 hypothetical protein C8E87_2684 [Actinoplanes brasiliensis]GID33347.1 hypothetical protein Abr02nite_83300 [Actinoplanes brasiliensis]
MTEAPSTLADLLRLATWSPRDLVAAVNTRLSRQGRDRLRIDATAGYFWLRGGQPRPHMRWLVAAVLSERLGFKVDTGQLWPGTQGSEIAAASGFESVSHVDDLVRELGHLSTVAATPLSPVGDASGLDLVAAVLDQFGGISVPARLRPDHEKVHPEQVDLVAAHVADLRRLDDRHGGGALSVRYVTAQLRSTMDMVEYASYDAVTGRRLLAIIADLAQLLGWLHFDSSHYGAAERYLLLSVGVCRALHDTERAANVIGMLSYVSAFAGHGRQAQHLAEAAHAESRSADPIMRARLLGREATAAAADGDITGFRRCAEEATALLSDGDKRQPRPAFLYYLSPLQLAAETGQALVTLANQSTAHRTRLLDEGIEVLSAAVTEMTASDDANGPAYARSGLLHSTFLARALVQRGRTSDAIGVIRADLPLLPTVQSPRGRSYLKSLRPTLGRHARSAEVKAFLPEFDAALLNA